MEFKKKKTPKYVLVESHINTEIQVEVPESFPYILHLFKMLVMIFNMFWKLCSPLNLYLYDCQGTWFSI